MRLTRLPLLAVVLAPLLPMLPVSSAVASSGSVRVSAVVRDSSGHLSVRDGRAADVASARWLAGRWRSESNVVAAGLDHRIHVAGSPDPLAPSQWALSTLHAADVGRAEGQVVAVVDTGVDATHPDLAGVVLSGADCEAGQPGAGCTGAGNTDPNGHGTHVAGIVAAVADNGIGGAGLAQGALVMPVRVMADDGSGWDSDAAQGVLWAVDHGATVVNLSFGGPDPSPVMDSAVSYAVAHGVTVVVAAGNEGQAGNAVEWPAADPGVIAVGAVNAAGVHPAWSNTGDHVAVVAPGVQILSTLSSQAPASSIDPADPPGYASWDGTSMAAPFVSAAAALLRHAQPALSGAGVRQRLMDTADDLGAPGRDPIYGAGRINVVAAEAATGPVSVPPVPVMSARISATRTTVPYAGAVTVSGRVLSDGIGTAGVPVRLERQVGTSWVETRAGASGVGGLASWVLHPDRTTYYRFVGDGWSSALLRIAVTPVVSLTAHTTGVSGRVLPARATAVRIDVHRSTGWATLTTVTSGADGSYRLVRPIAAGTYVRAVALGTVSPTARAT